MFPSEINSHRSIKYHSRSIISLRISLPNLKTKIKDQTSQALSLCLFEYIYKKWRKMISSNFEQVKFKFEICEVEYIHYSHYEFRMHHIIWAILITLWLY